MAHDGSDPDWAGALIVAEMADDLKAIRMFLDGFAQGAKKKARGGKRGRRR